MRKNKLIFGIAVSIAVATLVTVSYVVIRNIIEENRLSGHMLLSICGFYDYDIKKNKISRIDVKGINEYTTINLNSDKTKFISYDGKESNNVYLYTIYEVNIKKQSKTVITSFQSKWEYQFLSVQYVPNSGFISYIIDNKLMLYDLKTKAQTPLVNVYNTSVSYSWSNNGNNLIYLGAENSIFQFDRKNKVNKKLLDGSDPIYSNSNKYIAYSTGGSNTLCLYNNANKSITKIANIQNSFKCFSPDEKYIAVGEPNFFLGCLAPKVIAINIETGKRKTIIKNKYASTTFAWD